MKGNCREGSDCRCSQGYRLWHKHSPGLWGAWGAWGRPSLPAAPGAVTGGRLPPASRGVLKPVGKGCSRAGRWQASSVTVLRGAKVTPLHPASAVGIHGRSHSHLALNINISACEWLGAACTHMHVNLSDMLHRHIWGSQCLLALQRCVQSPLPPWPHQDLSPVPEEGHAWLCCMLGSGCDAPLMCVCLVRLFFTVTHACAAASTRYPKTMIYFFAALKPLVHFSVHVCGCAGLPCVCRHPCVTPCVHKQPGKDSGRAGGGCRGTGKAPGAGINLACQDQQ